MALKSRNKIKAEFSMSSMTDIIFLLLIFFIITSKTVKEPALKMILPKGTNTQVVNQVIHIAVDQNLNYTVDSKEVSFDRLPSELAKVLSDNPEATVSVQADKRIEYDKVMELVKIADDQDAKVVLALSKK